MNFDKEILDRICNQVAKAVDLSHEDIQCFIAAGEKKVFEPSQWLFHESTPREWAGIVIEGDVQIVRGLHGKTHHVGTLITGALISEAIFIDKSSHNNSASTRGGATILAIPLAQIDALKAEKPDVFYRIVSRIAVGINRRLQNISEQLHGQRHWERPMAGFRLEHDSLGQREISGDAYYGVQTQRAIENFPISGVPVSNFCHLIEGMAFVKKAAALANCELGALSEQRRDAIVGACDELLAGKLHENFAVDMFQGGAGTSTNMNANEVIANRGLELMGLRKGEYQHLHPNDHVNCSQSTNDAYPTAIKLSVLLSHRNFVRSMQELHKSLLLKADEFSDVLKMGRTENQDAVPMTLGQEFAAYAGMVASALRATNQAAEELLSINMGATAIGTGINSPPGYAKLVTKKLAEVSGFDLRLADNLVEATQNAGTFVQMSATMKRAAVQISKICNDLRWMSSGPRCGLNEINLPAMQPGSSIMPGKVNPVIPEVVSQICYQVMGYDAVVSMAAEASELELCMAEPIIAYDLLHGMMILKNACVILSSRCVKGIEANREVCRGYVENSIGLITALVPVLGYEPSAAIAKEALKTGGSVYHLILKKGLLSKEELDDMLRPENMTDPREIPHHI